MGNGILLDTHPGPLRFVISTIGEISTNPKRDSSTPLRCAQNDKTFSLKSAAIEKIATSFLLAMTKHCRLSMSEATINRQTSTDN
jgi:hypothetical protein